MLSVTMVGCGAIGRSVMAELIDDANVRVAQIITPEFGIEAVRAAFPDAAVASGLDELPETPELVIECAGHAAVVEHVLLALERGIDCIVCSIGALSDAALAERLEAAARAGSGRVQLVAGAIGGIDAIAAARIGGLDSVVYTGRKPPRGWQGTPAEEQFDLDTLDHAAEFFSGSARDAARLFPKNANVAATVSLAGIGLDDTEVHLIADPAVERNIHNVHVSGAFGDLELTLAGRTLPSNPKTSALTVYSAVRALRNRVSAFAI